MTAPSAVSARTTDESGAISLNPVNAVFVSSASSLEECPGGVQICTRDYLAHLRLAGLTVSIVRYTPDRRLYARLRRRVTNRPYSDVLAPDLLGRVCDEVATRSARFVILNGPDAGALAVSLRQHLPATCRIVLHSYGLESVDYLHELRIGVGSGDFGALTSRSTKRLARQLIAECAQRRAADQVHCLAPFEVEIERWLGARDVLWLPRTIPSRELVWRPERGRIGFVGRLDHPPNVEGLLEFLTALGSLGSPGITVRLVGGPHDYGVDIQKRFPFVEYLGALSDPDLDVEASTWLCFVHPLFFYARGCSTKLAVALGWRIPVITTTAGCRGYLWRDGELPIRETPTALAELAVRMTDLSLAEDARRAIGRVADSAPRSEDVAATIRASLLPQSAA